MTCHVVECLDKAQLDAYRQSDEFKADFPYAAEHPATTCITEGETLNVEVDERGTTGTLYGLLIEDEGLEDNATYRLESDGLHFWATGVEV